MRCPELAGHFARVVTHGSPYAQSLIDDRAVKDKAPHIAISVDVIDTGIDVPEVVAGMNLDNFVVRPHRNAVETYSAADAWTTIAPEDTEALLALTGLPWSVRNDDEDARRFDVLILPGRLA